jgi:hypothetical protein
MKYNKLATVFCSAALGLMALTSCEGGDLYSVGAPSWISAKADSIANAKSEDSGEVIEGLQEDVYDIGKADYSAGFFTLGKTYVVPAGEKWQAQFNLLVNPDNKYYKNFYIVLNNYSGELGDEYGVIRFDNDPTKNSEWNTVGEEIDRSLVGGNFTNSSGNDDTDGSVQQMNGKITLTVDRSNGGLYIEMTNGTLTKTYTQTTSFPSTGSDTDLACRIGVEGSLVSFLGSTIEPIGGFTSREDKKPLSMVLNGVPKKVLLGATMEEAFANVTATVEFEQGVTKDIPASELNFQTIPDMFSLGKKTLMAAYAKTFKGEAADPVIGAAEFAVVDKLYTSVGATDNSTAFWGDHSQLVKVAAGETFVTRFTNYTSGQNNWNNFVIVLTKSNNDEYAVVRADNFGWGAGYDNNPNLVTSGGQADWGAWLAAMDGAKVTTAVTNNGDGTADVQAVMEGTNGVTYVQEYKGIAIDDPDDFYFHFTVDGSHIEFDDVVGAEDNSTAFWGAHSVDFAVPEGRTVTTRIKNFSNLQNNWNNTCVVLTSDGTAEYAVVRADNFGWGAGYDENPNLVTSGGQSDWAAWLAAMDDAYMTISVTNHGTSADVKMVMVGNDGVTYYQDYLGIAISNDLLFRFTVDGSHLVFE